jgi:hypothetical protein
MVSADGDVINTMVDFLPLWVQKSLEYFGCFGGKFEISCWVTSNAKKQSSPFKKRVKVCKKHQKCAKNSKK